MSPFSGRHHRANVLRLCLVLGVLGICTGTLVPFRFDLSLAGPDRIFGLADFAVSGSPLSDLIANIVVYAPLGGLIAFGIGRRTRLTLGVVGAGLAALTLSTSLEWAQTTMSARVASWVDVGMNVLGGVLGALATVALIQMRSLRGRLACALRDRPFSMAVKLLSVGLIAYHLLPFDFVMTGEALQNSLRGSRLTFGTYGLTAGDWVGWVAIVGQFALLGGLCFLSGPERRVPVRAAVLGGIAHVAILAIAIEILQVFSQSHTMDVRDAFAGVVGGVVGVTLIVVLPMVVRRPWGRVAVGLFIVGQVTLLLASGLSPFEFRRPVLSWSSEMFPFWAEFHRPFGAAAAYMIETASAYGLLAVAIWMITQGWSLKMRKLFVLAAVPTAALLCEVAQLFVAGRYATLTAPVIALCIAMVCVVAEPRVLSRSPVRVRANRTPRP